MQRICVFCGSSVGKRPLYTQAAQLLGQTLAQRRLQLVFGAGHVGLMGVVADAVLCAGGQAIGVIPQALVDKELAHQGLTELRVVSTMHERKAMMADLADGFLALPGGFGTADELFEILTWAQLGIHAKPIGLLDIAGFFGPLLAWIEHAVTEGFLRPEHRHLLLVEQDPVRLVERLLAFRPDVALPKWIDRQDR